MGFTEGERRTVSSRAKGRGEDKNHRNRDRRVIVVSRALRRRKRDLSLASLTRTCATMHLLANKFAPRCRAVGASASQIKPEIH